MLPSSADKALPLPAALVGKAEILSPQDPDYIRAAITKAIQPAGSGGISSGLVVRITKDIPAYRLWSGPTVVNSNGQTNRIGQWWGYDAPTGTRPQYRQNYEICNNWNTLSWVATCTLKAGAVLAIGPGQSASPTTCDDPSESYPANPTHWQSYIDKAWSRPTELACPNADQDYEDDPNNIAQRHPSPKT